jgi:putative ABC transport system permease protein
MARGAGASRRLVLRMAVADALHDRWLFACAALTVAAVLLPLLLLLALKTGIVERLLAELRADPAATELRLRGNVALPPEWFERMARRPEVGFLVPRVRTFGNALSYARADDPIRARQADLISSGPGDPLLGAMSRLVEGDRVLVSKRVSEEAGLRPGDALVLWRPLPRGGSPRPRIEFRVTVAAIAPDSASSQRHIFGTAALAGRLEDSSEQDPVAVPEAEATPRVFAAFRLYARDITGVAPLAEALEAEGLEVETHAARIGWVFRTDRNLTLLFLVLVGCAAIGVALALAATLWGNVLRKRRALSLLRLLGCPARRLALFPIVQAGLVALAGAALAAAGALCGAALMNAVFAPAFGLPGLATVLAWHLAAATGATLGIALLAGAAAVRPILGIAPAEGLREGW